MRHSMLPLAALILGARCGTPIDTRECDWSVTDLLMESSSRALLHYCLATSPASESMMSELSGPIKTPVAVIEKFCHSTGSMNRFHSSILNILNGAWTNHKAGSSKNDYDFLMTLTDNIKDRNYVIAQRKIGNFIAELYERVAIHGCPNKSDEKMMMTAAETLFAQLRGIVGNTNFAHLFGLKTITKPSISMMNSGKSELLTMTRAGLKLPSDRPVALYMSSSANQARIVELGATNYVDVDTTALYRSVLRDIQPRSEIFIISGASLPAINDQFLSVIGAAQSEKVKINVIMVSENHIPKRSRDLYQRMAEFTHGHTFVTEADALYQYIPLIEYSLMENQAMIISRRSVPLNSARFNVVTDMSMRGMTIYAACALGSAAPKIKIFEPSGDFHVEYVSLTQVANVGFWLVENIAVGSWSVEVRCQMGPIDFEVKSESRINFEVDQSDASDDTLVLKSLSIPTLKINSATLITSSADSDSQTYFEPDIVKLGAARMKKSGNNGVLADGIDYDWMPDEDLDGAVMIEKKSAPISSKFTGPKNSMTKVTATDSDGNQVQREVPVFDAFLKIVDDVQNMDFQPGNTVFVTIKVHNDNEVMHFTATDFEGWVDSVSPSTTSSANKYSLVKVKITAPSDVKIGAESQVTITARDNSLNRIESTKFILSVGQTENPEVKKMLVESNIENRFGRTIVQSKVVNQHRNPRDAVFSVFLPDSAFITSYQLYIRNHTFKGEIIEPQALENPTDWVTPSTVTMENEHEWRVKVRMDQWDEAIFELVYDQPIMKTNGKYPYKVNLQGRQEIDDIDIQVALYDEDGIADVAVIDENTAGMGARALGDFGAGLFEGLPPAGADVEIAESRKSAKISFNPMESFDEMSRSLGNSDAAPEPLEEAKFNMEYEVDSIDTSDSFCTISSDDDYFVQFCNPPLPTFVADNATMGEYGYDVILMLDTSGSMYGEKLSHAVDALKSIIQNLPEADNFNIIRYGNKVRSWRQTLAKSEEKSKEKAFEFLSEILAGGSTDLEGALLEAIQMTSFTDKSRIPIILFLTDGGANASGRDVQEIVQTVTDKASREISINGISLGTNDLAGWQLVQRLTQKNRGLSAKMFDISTFEREIPRKFAEMKSHARSLRGLTDIRFGFNADHVTDLTNTAFEEYSAGSDLVVLGRLVDSDIPFITVNLEYTDVEGKVWSEEKQIPVRKIDNSEDRDAKFGAEQDGYNPIKQQWAVTAVHQLLQKRAMAQSEREFNLLTNEAKKLSYDHHIVSPVVSFLVRKPKSSLNLIDNRLQGDSAERERRSEKVQETHEIRYQYRKLWWRTNQQDGLESAKDELDQIKGKSKKLENLESKNFWLGLGSAPLMVYHRINDFLGSIACLKLPKLSGMFKLIELSDTTIEGVISNQKLGEIKITSSEGIMKYEAGVLLVEKEGHVMDIGESKQFKFGAWLVRKVGADLSTNDKSGLFELTHLYDDMRLSLSTSDNHIDVEINSNTDIDTGLLGEFNDLNVSILEKQGKAVQTTTLMINENYVNAELITSSSDWTRGSNGQCWSISAENTQKLL